MKYLLHGYYIDYHSNNKSKLCVLCLLHELRVISRRQLLELINLEFYLSMNGLKATLRGLVKNNLVDKNQNGKEVYYFLTKEGHLSIGGFYTFPKVPEYNLNHHLQINNYLIKTIRLVKDHEHLKRIISERRIVYEAKDLNSHAKGRKFFVPDFRVRFRDKNRLEINWSFEIELTMKTRRRYRSSIFPKYIKELEKNRNAHVIYVTPSGAIREELEAFKRVFYQAETKKDARLGELFDRFHILSDKNFETELKYLLETDPGINWLPEKENTLYQDGSVQETLELFVEEKKGEEKEETEKEENKSSKSKMKFNPEAF
ncbi:replication-relaxation family protein [Enterococcus faecium]|uniref:replication-relaxation family protein n=1 Tax=Enterococcus faecium TaxID=1352 RepID=UPI0019132971|nr:replication-relaxation family protein [Enterococcus faecium]MBK5028554.1 replication-relaxation family protein [Enterococcus faecium]MBK5039257.1 replication-relaxation family protein [Enterococcus faecium]MBK5044198.1 replication-relaxation family protein [Enterococcus faecium]MBK5069121.1 replication-relaxation family protein [Enterococcus faecium]MBK5132623.1 replication-relaxation family protein [Enterococcus faecium]